MVNGIVTSNGIDQAGAAASDLMAEINSRETPVQKVRELATRARINERPGLSEARQAEVLEHNRSVECLTGACNESLQKLAEAVVVCTNSDDYDDLFNAAEVVKTDVPIRAQQAVRLCTRAIEISQGMLADREGLPAELEAEAEKVVAKVKSQLTKMGCGIESTQGWLNGNPKAAEHQFDHLARYGNVHSREAIFAAKNARAENSAIQQSIGSYTTLLGDAKKLLISVAKRALRG